MIISPILANRLQTVALAHPLRCASDPIRAVLPRGKEGLAFLLSANY